MKIINLISIITFIFISISLQAKDLNLQSLQKKIDVLKNRDDFKNQSNPENATFKILDELTSILNKSNINKKVLEDSLIIISSLSIIEERFPKEVKISFPKNFLV